MSGRSKTRPAQADADARAQARQGRTAALVIAGTGVIWLVAQVMGGSGMIPLRFMMLIDLMALAAFFWALVVTWRIWRARDKS